MPDVDRAVEEFRTTKDPLRKQELFRTFLDAINCHETSVSAEFAVRTLLAALSREKTNYRVGEALKQLCRDRKEEYPQAKDEMLIRSIYLGHYLSPLDLTVETQDGVV